MVRSTPPVCGLAALWSISVAAAGCAVELPAREHLAESVDAGPADATGATDAAPPVHDAAEPRPDARVPPVRDAAPPMPDGPASIPPFPDASGPDPVDPHREICDGLDNDEDGDVDEDGDAYCLSLMHPQHYCRDGGCKTCVVETNEGCRDVFTCVPAGNDNLCAQCTPESNGCAGGTPFCDPMTLTCKPCPVDPAYGGNQRLRLCNAPPFGGHCIYEFPNSSGDTVTCSQLCAHLSLECAGGWYAQPADDGSPARMCQADEPVPCDSARLEGVICDCVQHE